MLIIQCHNDYDNHISKVDTDELELHFVTTGGWLVNPPVHMGEKAFNYLSTRIARNKYDLNSHVQKIVLAQALNHSEKTFDALLDLFIALGEKGLPLRTRMLTRAARNLPADQIAFFRNRLKTGVNSTDIVPTATGALLSGGTWGNCTIIRKVESNRHQDQEDDPLTTARQLIDMGYIEDARLMLEEALITSPQHTEICDELLALYRHTRDKKNLDVMLDRLQDTPPANIERWQQLSEQLAEHLKEHFTL